jgi:hypothetical protein
MYADYAPPGDGESFCGAQARNHQFRTLRCQLWILGNGIAGLRIGCSDRI